LPLLPLDLKCCSTSKHLIHKKGQPPFYLVKKENWILPVKSNALASEESFDMGCADRQMYICSKTVLNFPELLLSAVMASNSCACTKLCLIELAWHDETNAKLPKVHLARQEI
jgi:hypothetical protein